MKKPKKCCEVGEHTCTVPMPILGRSRDIDFCVADLVAALNAANILEQCKHFESESILKELDEIHENDPDSVYEYYDVVYDRENWICSNCDCLEYCTLPALERVGAMISEVDE